MHGKSFGAIKRLVKYFFTRFMFTLFLRRSALTLSQLNLLFQFKLVKKNCSEIGYSRPATDHKDISESSLHLQRHSSKADLDCSHNKIDIKIYILILFTQKFAFKKFAIYPPPLTSTVDQEYWAPPSELSHYPMS